MSINRSLQQWPSGEVMEIKVERRSDYQGLPAWGITGCAEIAANRKTAQKWADAENNARRARKLSAVPQSSHN